MFRLRQTRANDGQLLLLPVYILREDFRGQIDLAGSQPNAFRERGEIGHCMTMLPALAWPENEGATASRAYGKPTHWRYSLSVRSARGAVRYVDTAPAFITPASQAAPSLRGDQLDTPLSILKMESRSRSDAACIVVSIFRYVL